MRGTFVLIAVGRGALSAAAVGALAAVALAITVDNDPFAILIAVEAVVVLPVVVCGAAAIQASPRNVVGWLLVLGGTFSNGGTFGYLYGRAVFDHGRQLPFADAIAWLDGWPWVPGQLAIAFFAPLAFPDGRLPSRRWRIVVAVQLAVCGILMAAAILQTGLLDWPDQPSPSELPGAAGYGFRQASGLIVLVAPLVTLSGIGFEYKRRRTADPDGRAAMDQVRPAVWLFVAAWWGCIALAAARLPTLYSLPVESLGMVATGVTCWIAIRRFHLFDARLVIRRSLVYAGLSLAVLIIYLATAVTLTQLGASRAAVPVALVLAVLLAVPLHSRLQKLANRLVYGTRNDPVATMLNLGDQLERAAAAEDVLPAAARSLQRTLRLGHVAIRAGESTIASAGRPSAGRTELIPLIYAGELVGTLVVTQSDDDSSLDDQRRGLLVSIARPIAAAVQATSLTRQLAGSHERLVAATEDERRRLRRDLHDGLGPTLSSAVLGVGRAKSLLVSRPRTAADQLELVTAQLQDAVGEIRRLVYDLRPPALDLLGLVGALTEQARSLGVFTVAGPAALPPLGAAVEVAAYRIVMEAMTNAIRHGGAGSGVVDICIDHCNTDGSSDASRQLRLTISDEGTGLPEGYRAGVGITSMRERAVSLGGNCTVEQGETGGTVVRAWLPLTTV